VSHIILLLKKNKVMSDFERIFFKSKDLRVLLAGTAVVRLHGCSLQYIVRPTFEFGSLNLTELT